MPGACAVAEAVRNGPNRSLVTFLNVGVMSWNFSMKRPFKEKIRTARRAGRGEREGGYMLIDLVLLETNHGMPFSVSL